MPKTNDITDERRDVVASAHYGIRPRAFEGWRNAVPSVGLAATAEPVSGEILIYGLILPHEESTFLRDCFGDETSMSALMFRDLLAAIDGEVTLRINSPGGDVWEASAMINAIDVRREAGGVVNAVIDGIAASAASLLAMACGNVRMARMGTLMIHEAAGGIYGTMEDMNRAAALLGGIDDAAAQVYAKRTSGTVAEMRALMVAETYMSATQSLEQKFVDAVVGNDAPDGEIGAIENRNRRLAAIVAAVNIGET